MKITIVQSDIIWEKKQENLDRLDTLISSLLPGQDIIILPEMFNTGFSMNPELLFEEPGSTTFEWMKTRSAEGNFGICGSYIVRENGLYFNRWMFVSPDGHTWYYDKRHLFSPGGEDKLFSRGQRRLVFKFRGVRICANVCYDLRFPVWNRNRNDYDLLINSANWPETRMDVWTTLLRARALDNQCYVAGANRTGTDGEEIKYNGESIIVNPYGEIIVSAEKNKECTISAEISMDFLNDFRSKFNVLNDADDFTINP